MTDDRPAEASAEHYGVEHGAPVQPPADDRGGLVCVASGPAWSLFWPEAEWTALDQAERRRICRRARRRYEVELVEDDDDMADSYVNQDPPAWRDWRD